MANQKISELTALTGATAATGDTLPIVDTDAGTTKKITVDELRQGLALLSPQYAGIIEQDGTTAAPTDTVMVNGLGTTMTWTRVSAGRYRVTAGAAVFTSGKTMARICGYPFGLGNEALFGVRVQSTTQVDIYVRDFGGTLTDGLAEAQVFIYVFPS